MLPTVAPALPVHPASRRVAPAPSTPRALAVPRHIGAAERVSAEEFEDAYGVPYKPRQARGAHARATCGGPASGATIIWLAEHRERRGLPRYGANSPIRHDPPEPGRYAQVGVSWWTREHWVRQVVPAVADDHPEILKHHHVARDTFLCWADRESLYAQQQRSGRDVVVRPDTIAGLMVCAERTVQRCRAAARSLGLLVDVVKGRMLNLQEVTAARQAGSPQRGLSNVSALVVPTGYSRRVTRPQPVRHVTPTRGRSSQQKSSVIKNSSSLTHRSAKVKGAAQAPHSPTKKAPPALSLATDLCRKATWLQSTSPRRLVGQLKPFAEQPFPWAASDLIEEMDQIQRRLGYSTPQRAHHSPWALLRWYLDQINAGTSCYRSRRTRALRRPWCGHCHSDGHRWVDSPDGTSRPCPRCSPQAVTSAPSAA